MFTISEAPRERPETTYRGTILHTPPRHTNRLKINPLAELMAIFCRFRVQSYKISMNYANIYIKIYFYPPKLRFNTDFSRQ